MYTKPRYSLKDMLQWTRAETVLFFVIATVPVVLFDVFGQRWLHVPWLPVALVGTAVAFVISYQNNASYDRLWEARKICDGRLASAAGSAPCRALVVKARRSACGRRSWQT
jgi:putative membrane protein